MIDELCTVYRWSWFHLHDMCMLVTCNRHRVEASNMTVSRLRHGSRVCLNVKISREAMFYVKMYLWNVFSAHGLSAYMVDGRR